MAHEASRKLDLIGSSVSLEILVIVSLGRCQGQARLVMGC